MILTIIKAVAEASVTIATAVTDRIQTVARMSW